MFARWLHSTFRRLAPVFLVALVALSLSCSAQRHTTAPSVDSDLSIPSGGRAGAPGIGGMGGGGNSASGFYPIHLGNHWSYARQLVTTWQVDDDPPYDTGIDSRLDLDQVCEEMQDGRRYTIERTLESVGPYVYPFWVRVRQDRTGLYEADDTNQPDCDTAPARARGGVADADPVEGRWSVIAAGIPAQDHVVARSIFDRHRELLDQIHALVGTAPRGSAAAPPELVRLVYPLHSGASWIVRQSPLFAETVEGVDPLKTVAGTFAAYRIRIDSEFFGPHDRVVFWYGRSGYLGIDVHLEGEGTDPYGHHYHYVTHESQTLIQLSLIEDHGPQP